MVYVEVDKLFLFMVLLLLLVDAQEMCVEYQLTPLGASDCVTMVGKNGVDDRSNRFIEA